MRTMTMMAVLLAATAATPLLAQDIMSEQRIGGGQGGDQVRERRAERPVERAPEARAESSQWRVERRVETPNTAPTAPSANIRGEEFRGARNEAWGGNWRDRPRMQPEPQRDGSVVQAVPTDVRPTTDGRGDWRGRNGGVRSGDARQGQWRQGSDGRWNDGRRFDNRGFDNRQFDNRRFDNRQFDNRQFDNRSWSRDWRQDRRYDWQGWRFSNRNVFRDQRYSAPFGWNYGYRRFGIGITLSNSLFGQDYWIDDPYSYRLPPAYGAYRWVRYYNDVLLVDLRTGRVVDVVYDFFW